MKPSRCPAAIRVQALISLGLFPRRMWLVGLIKRQRLSYFRDISLSSSCPGLIVNRQGICPGEFAPVFMYRIGRERVVVYNTLHAGRLGKQMQNFVQQATYASRVPQPKARIS